MIISSIDKYLVAMTFILGQRYSWRMLLLALISVNFLAVCIMWFSLDKRCGCTGQNDEEIVGAEYKGMLKINKAALFERAFDLPNTLVTVIFRELETYEHDLGETLLSYNSVFSRMKMLVVTDSVFYPPITSLPSTAKCLHLDKEFIHNFNHTQLSSYVHTEYVLISPDNVRLTQPAVLTMMVKFLINNPDRMAAVAIGDVQCVSLDVDYRSWTLTYKKQPENTMVCDAIIGAHVVLIPTKLLFSLPFPMERPFPESLYIQTAFRKIKTQILPEVHMTKPVKKLFKTPHLAEKHARYEKYRKQMLLNKFGIKKVVMPSGDTEWYGCTKSTERCFGTVLRDTPDYLFKGRWTPPCCLENLRVTARHVFEVLEKYNVRYWLEGGSLLGAARHGDIIPWDYDVDIGIYEEDIERYELLAHAKKGQKTVDPKGFVWERATEGDFYRVQFSATNRVHVDIFPFRSNNGTMTKDTWFKSHPQDREFPEDYLKPLTRIKFAGVYASAPNNVTRFLAFKFGKGVIENPQYPNPEVLKFPEKKTIR